MRNPSLSPTVQTTATTTMQPTIIEKAYYKIVRKRDNLVVIPYGTGSGNEEFTRLSYDSKGNYFDLVPGEAILIQCQNSYRLKAIEDSCLLEVLVGPGNNQEGITMLEDDYGRIFEIGKEEL